jgi:hypothetical protein
MTPQGRHPQPAFEGGVGLRWGGRPFQGKNEVAVLHPCFFFFFLKKKNYYFIFIFKIEIIFYYFILSGICGGFVAGQDFKKNPPPILPLLLGISILSKCNLIYIYQTSSSSSFSPCPAATSSSSSSKKPPVLKNVVVLKKIRLPSSNFSSRPAANSSSSSSKEPSVHKTLSCRFFLFKQRTPIQ